MSSSPPVGLPVDERDTNTAIRLAREASELLAREVQKGSRRYAGFAHLPTQDGVVAAAELERAVRERRLLWRGSHRD